MDPQLQAIGLGRLAPVTSKDTTTAEGGAKQQQQQQQQHQSESGPYQQQPGDSVSYQSVSSVGCSSSQLLLMSSARLGSSGISCSDVLNTIKSSGMIDSVEDCRTQLLSDTGYNISVNSGRMSPCYSNSYATLTPLQPLPPISTVSEKFGGLVSASNGGSFVFMQSGDLGMTGYDGGDGDGEDGREECSFSYKYQKDPEIETTNNHINYDAMEPVSPVELLSRGASGNYGQLRGSPYASFNHTGMVKSEGVTMSADTHSPYSTYASNLMSVEALPMKSTTQTLAPMKNASQTMAPMMQQMVNNHGASLHQHLQPHLHQSCLLSADAHQQHQILAPTVTAMRHVNTSPIQDQPSSSTDSHEDSRQEMEEINTREIAQKVSNELKKYSIPQAVFAQRILGRSQGTLSDLLRNPKPWSKLKSGRETFRRMWKWLQDSECQRLAQLRMAGEDREFVFIYRSKQRAFDTMIF